MKISELISVSIVIMAAITIVFIGTTKLTAYQGNDLNLDNIIDEVAIHMTNSLFQAQNDVSFTYSLFFLIFLSEICITISFIKKTE